MSKNKGTINCYSNVSLKLIERENVLKTFNFHNTVTLNLFRGINAFLKGEVVSPNSASNYLPRYLGVSSAVPQNGYTVSSNYLENEFNMPRMQLTNNNSSIKDNKILIIPFTALIPHSSVGSNELKSLGLFGTPQLRGNPDDNQLLLAAVDIRDYVEANQQPTSANFSQGTYYIKNEDGTYSLASGYNSSVTYYEFKGITLSPGSSLVVEWNINLQGITT